MKKLYTLIAILAVSGCCLTNYVYNIKQHCLFNENICQNNLEVFKNGLDKFGADGGLYVIQDMDTADIIEITTINYQDTGYHPYFRHLQFNEKIKPSQLLAQYIDEVSKSHELEEKLRKNVLSGTAKNANIDAVKVFGTTATTEKENSPKVITTFLGHFEQNHKNYAMIVILDNPQPLKSTFGFRSAGWNAAPIARNIIGSINQEYNNEI